MHVDAPRVDVPFQCKCDSRIAVHQSERRDGSWSDRWRTEIEGNLLLSQRGAARTFTTPERAYRAAADFIVAAKAKEDALLVFHQPETPKTPSPKKDLPKTFQGAEVVRGEGMNSDKLDTFVERRAMDKFDATADMWLVIENNALEDVDDTVEVKGFDNKAEAVRFAQARSNGNVDHRVLRVTNQVLVISTMRSDL
jgi:ribosomal protein L4